jgi:hypothetical protein
MMTQERKSNKPRQPKAPSPIERLQKWEQRLRDLLRANSAVRLASETEGVLAEFFMRVDMESNEPLDISEVEMGMDAIRQYKKMLLVYDQVYSSYEEIEKILNEPFGEITVSETYRESSPERYQSLTMDLQRTTYQFLEDLRNAILRLQPRYDEIRDRVLMVR